MTAIIEQVGILGIIMLIGFAVVKFGYVDIKIKDSISKLIVNLVLPCLIISSISSKSADPELLKDIIVTIVASLFCIFTMFLFGILTAKLFKIPDASKAVHKLLCALGNVIFVGYPVITSVYGEAGFLYTIIYWLVNDMFLWTVGVLMLSEKEPGSKSGMIKKLLNPNTISFAIAILMFIFGIKLPSVIGRAVSGIGDITTPLSMIFIGMTLGGVEIKNALKKWWIFVILPIKMIIMPLLFILLFNFIGLKDIILGVVVLEVAMPAQTVLSILANEHQSDTEYASVGMFFTTIASLFTLPFVSYMLQVMIK